MLFDSNLEPIEEHRNKLLYILLHHYVYWLAERFICHAECRRDEVHSCSLLEIPENSLNLMQDVIVNHSLLGIKCPNRFLTVIYPHQEISELFIHVKLLQHRIHIANIP
jgi:hypothetical protein